MDFITAWVLIIGFCIIMYVILDGFTLGTGLIMPFLPERDDRNILFSAILPTWDGNQTWLVLFGASLYGAFPLAFSMILPTLYLPLMLMIVSLLFRGIVFEFRLKAHGDAITKWDRLFITGCYIATFMQGLVVGTFVQGFTGAIDSHVIPAYNWLTPFTLFTGVSLVFGYMLLGSTRMIMKTVDQLQDKLGTIAMISLVFVAVFMITVSLWSPFIDPHIKQKWLYAPGRETLVILPIAAILAFLACFYALWNKKEYAPYWLSVLLFVCAYAGFGYTSWPYIVPYDVTIQQAAAPLNSLKFTFVGAVIMIPVLLFYTWYSYKIFKGKVTDVIHY